MIMGKFFRGFLVNSSGIITSRILGFIRDLLMANTLGASIYSDIFFVAFKIPNLFRRIFSEGAFNQAFLPSFLKAQYKGAFALGVLGIFSLFLIAFSLLVVCFSPLFTKLLAWGFSEELIALSAPLVAINFWYLLLVFIVSFCGALLQAKHNFTAWAFSPALLNVAMIGALIYAKDKDSYEVVVILSYGVLVGGVLQILLHIIPLKRLGFLRLLRYGFIGIKTRWSQTKAALRDFFGQFFPAMLGSSSAQIAAFIDTILATFLPIGSISYLYYANRIFQLPLSIFAIATSTALFPIVARAIKQKQVDTALVEMTKSFWFLMILLSLCTGGGLVLSEFIISLLFEHGEFSHQDALVTSSIFSAYLIGLLPFGLSRIFSLWLYSHAQQGRAAKISAISLCFGTCCSLLFMQFWGAFGLALGGTMGGFLLFLLTLNAFGWKLFFKILSRLRMWIILFVSLLITLPILLVLNGFLIRLA